MDTGDVRSLPAELERVRRKFERWGAVRKGRARIPDTLWALAPRVAATRGFRGPRGCCGSIIRSAGTGPARTGSAGQPRPQQRPHTACAAYIGGRSAARREGRNAPKSPRARFKHPVAEDPAGAVVGSGLNEGAALKMIQGRG